ncbi:MAG TPA: hypothetical protein VMU33_18030 [Burkholderiaceae bacterium]|nr:hypothetical protein [Burkholderiaceae bacterium]
MSFDIGSIISNAVSLAANAALGAVDEAFPPLAIAQSLGGLLTQGVGQAILNALPQLVSAGMPKFLAQEIEQVVNGAMKQLSGPSNSAADNQVSQQAGSQINDLTKSLTQSINDTTLQNMSGKGKKGSGSWLEALANALGDALNAQAQKITDLSNSITGTGSDQPKALAQLNVESQRMSFMMNTVDTALKTIGEGLATLARKQ